MGTKPDAGLGSGRSSPGTSKPSPRESGARSACERARTRNIRSATGGTGRGRREEAFGGEWFQIEGSRPCRRKRTATTGMSGRADDVRDHRGGVPDRPVEVDPPASTSAGAKLLRFRVTRECAETR